jgi:hypothetical protein
MSKDHKEQLKTHGERFTSHNVPLTFLQNEIREKERKEHEMKRHIQDIVADAANNNSKGQHSFNRVVFFRRFSNIFFFSRTRRSRILFYPFQLFL